ncbi:CoA-binding protein [Desulfolucanica intricata]|uniref:CoA-binding protein n=1 Tax=Desulfolucanica intricata TaxID=1285191 RepID=UPI00082B2CFB|nr:CoA-binding protein [Desulfolucanica intricata]
MGQNPSKNEIRDLLHQSKNIAIVGLSNKPDRDSYMVGNYLKNHGYKIFPVNPMIDEVLGEKAYPSLSDVSEKIDIVNIFRRSSEVLPIVEEAVKLKPRAIWMQLGVENETAARIAREAGLMVIMNHCIKVDHHRLVGD